MANQTKKYATIHYHHYLALDEVLGAQRLRSAEVGAQPAHDEMLFIIIHQVYELWFKQIIHELSSVADMFRGGHMDERNIGVAVGRLQRVAEIQELLIQQIRVLETMTPLDFLDFRNYLFPASGFQSFQFRQVEDMLGLQRETRITYNERPYDADFSDKQQEALRDLTSGMSLFDLVEHWLERTPFLQSQQSDAEAFNFLSHYQQAVRRMLKREEEAINASEYLSEADKANRLKMLGGTDAFFASVLDEKEHERMRANKALRLSYKATLAALFINLYREEPILQMPFNLLTCLVEIDENFTTWRYRHAQMVMRMLGRKIGTGGSSGHEYLLQTAIKHRIFGDLHHISTLLIPRSELPELPASLKRKLGFSYSVD